MNSESMYKLRFDRRLIRRRGWIQKDELTSELESLPDVADKATTLGEAADKTEGAPSSSGAEEPPAA